MSVVLMICDPEESKFSLLDRALKMAKIHEAKLHILDLVYIKGLSELEGQTKSSLAALQVKCIQRREQEINSALKQRGLNSKNVQLQVVWGKDLVAQTLASCKKLDPVMVIKRASTANRQAFYTPTDWQLIQRCPSPLLISPMRAFKKKPKVLVALDLATSVKSKMTLNHRLAAAGKRIADSTGAELHFACVATLSPILAELDIIEPSIEKRKMKAKLKPLLEEFQRSYGVDSKRLHFKAGQPAKVLNSLSQKIKADTVVMGATGRRGLKGKLLGNTAEQMLQHLSTDMLLIRP